MFKQHSVQGEKAYLLQFGKRYWGRRIGIETGWYLAWDQAGNWCWTKLAIVTGSGLQLTQNHHGDFVIRLAFWERSGLQLEYSQAGKWHGIRLAIGMESDPETDTRSSMWIVQDQVSMYPRAMSRLAATKLMLGSRWIQELTPDQGPRLKRIKLSTGEKSSIYAVNYHVIHLRKKWNRIYMEISAYLIQSYCLQKTEAIASIIQILSLYNIKANTYIKLRQLPV